MSPQPMSGYGVPEITGTWTPLDDSNSTLQFAETSQTAGRNGILAIRSTISPDVVLFATAKQVRNIPAAIGQGGRLAHLIP
jgi:hypothetical protein